MSNEVVAHFLNGTMVKGTSMDVDPLKPLCHIRPEGQPALEVKLADLKALYFVRTLGGDPKHREAEKTEPDDSRTRGAKGIQITFKDGEKLVGLTHHFPPVRQFFFVLPIDPKSNNVRILINKAATKDMSAAAV